MTTTSGKIAQETYQIVSKAWEDSAYRARLTENPHSAIKELGISPPDDLKIVVTDQTDADTSYLNIPPKPDMDNMELTDEQLEQVAGGEVLIGGAFFIAGVGVTAGFLYSAEKPGQVPFGADEWF